MAEDLKAQVLLRTYVKSLRSYILLIIRNCCINHNYCENVLNGMMQEKQKTEHLLIKQNKNLIILNFSNFSFSSVCSNRFCTIRQLAKLY